MSLTCPHCRKVLDFSGDPLRFCPYCGMAMGAEATLAGVSSLTQGLEDPAATVAHEYDSKRSLLASVPSNSRADSRSEVPDRLAGYRLIRRLGQGGMGTVHEAEDSETGRRVALKLIAPEFLTSTRAVERFLLEGRLASTIAHPRCVFVLAADEADGWPFIVMELMPGTTLKDLIESGGPMSSKRAIETILDVIEGLEEAHRRGVIHRDVKPSNCFLDDDGRIKVGDFGLSKSVVDNSGLTRTGTFIGTPHYASPEQIKGEEIDERSDVYSVCATLFYLLTGHPPFQGADAASTLAKIVSDPTPSARVHRPDLWVPLDRVIMRGLERDRRRRWSNLEELRIALSPFLPGRVTLSSLGLRLAAYAFDFCVYLFLIAVAMLAVGEAVERSARATFSEAGAYRLEEMTAGIVSSAVILLYLFLFEVLGEGSPGKRLLRLRIGSSEAGPATFRSRIIRLLVYAAIIDIPGAVVIFSLHVSGLSSRWADQGPLIAQLIAPLILFCCARPSNGFRGLHEFASGTAVVRLPWRFRRRRSVHPPMPPQAFHLFRPEGMPEVVGAYKVQGALRWTDRSRLLQAEDEGLKRLVWVVLRPEDRGPINRARTDLSRLARLRWLSSGAIANWRWDAFVEPTGHPLLVSGTTRTSRRTWSETREVLEELASELADATRDGALPDDLSLEQIWIKPNGRVLLLDVTPHSGDAPDETAGDGKLEAVTPRTFRLLGQVAIYMLQGRLPGRDTSGLFAASPIPLHAIPILEGLKPGADRYKSIDEFRDAIQSIRDFPSELSPVQQFGHAISSLLSGVVKIWLLPALVIAWMIITAYLTREPVPPLTERDWERTLLISSLLWVAMAMILREGLNSLIFNVALVTTKGRPASRLRFGLREFFFVAPYVLVNTLVDHLPATRTHFDLVSAYGGLIFALIWPVLNVLPILFRPGRYLNDWMARTILVAK